MANIIKLRRKTTTGVSAIANRAVGELEINHVDKTMTYKKDATTDFTFDFKTFAEAFVNAALTGTPTAPTATEGTNTTQIATTAFVKVAIDAIELGGTGDMTEAEYGGSDDGIVATADNALALGGVAASGYATQAEATAAAQTVLDTFIGAAPEALNTLLELAAALGDDPDFAATMTAALATKLDANSTIDGGEVS